MFFSLCYTGQPLHICLDPRQERAEPEALVINCSRVVRGPMLHPTHALDKIQVRSKEFSRLLCPSPCKCNKAWRRKLATKVSCGAYYRILCFPVCLWHTSDDRRNVPVWRCLTALPALIPGDSFLHAAFDVKRRGVT